MLLQVDGVTFATLYTETIGHDMAEGITTIGCVDALAIASRVGVAITLGPRPPSTRWRQLANTAGWAGRVIVEGAVVTDRLADNFEGNLLEGLIRLASAELGQVYATATGQIAFRGRGALPDNQAARDHGGHGERGRHDRARLGDRPAAW